MINDLPGIAIIGCGLIGKQRAASINNGRLVVCADIVLERAKELALASKNAIATEDWGAAITNPDVQIVIVATTNKDLAEITRTAALAGKHVLVEKPAARNTEELKPVMDAVRQTGVCVRVGFNHRYHRAIQKAKQLCDAGLAGDLMFLRGRYGHGGRIGYDKEWRANPDLSGGGELIDQGVHLIDLARWFLGDFSEISGFAHTYFWNMPVDDNGFMLLKTAKHQIAFLHASCTEWKNLFSMEIYGRNAKLDISGLGGSYGVERLTYYKMLPAMGAPETTTWEYPMGDDSWAVELAEFYEDIRLNREPSAGLRDAFEALKVVERIYKESGYDYNP